MRNRDSVVKARRLRRRAGQNGVLSEFATRMLAHIEARRKELEAIAYRSQHVYDQG